ncbi:MAG: RDD family protein [Acidobacteriota bacterium]|nr:RDD family protein [Acidobacteriota bacterium]
MTDNSNSNAATTQSANSSTLIEFPGRNRHRPAWRKELSERFREIQQRRAREAALEGESSPHVHQHNPEISAARAEQRTTTKQLGLVPQPDEPEMNPIVANALKRIERARNSAAPPLTHTSAARSHGPAAAAARVVEEQAEYIGELAPAHALKPAQAPQPQAAGAAAQAKPAHARADRTETEAEQARASSLVVVPPKQPAKSEPETEKPAPSEAPATRAAVAATEARATSVSAEPAAESATQTAAETQADASKPQPRHISGVIDEFWLERQGIELLPKVADPEVTYDDRASRVKRLAAALFDLFVVALLCAPFAAAIELTIGNWGDPRVAASMGGIVAVVLFLYQACSLALAGRTWGMSLCSLHAVDATSARVPTTGQCVRRALVLILSLATLGLGILYSLFDAEGRTAHDILSGTVVVKG